MLAYSASAGSVNIIVSNTKDESCLAPKESEEVTQYILNSEETIMALDTYFQGRPNLKMYDAAIVNARISFCSDVERKVVFYNIVMNLKQKNPSKRVFEVVTNYYRSKHMRQAMGAPLSQTDTSTDFKENILKAKRLAEKAWSK